MLLICPVRPGDSNPELQYALRSWEANLVLPGGLELWTVGYCPSWLSPDRHIEGNRHKSVPLAVFDNVLLAAQAATEAGYAECVFMNDDFFCMDPVGAILPVKRNSTLAEHIAQFPRNAGLWWPRSLALTASWLEGEGFPHPDSYEAHRPLLAAPGGMSEALMRWNEGCRDWTTDSVPQWRTAYGVLNKVEAYPVVDGKLGARTPGFGTPWISTSDESWRRYMGQIKPRFQKPSRWER